MAHYIALTDMLYLLPETCDVAVSGVPDSQMALFVQLQSCYEGAVINLLLCTRQGWTSCNLWES